MKLSTLDTAIVCGYALFIFVLAQWVSREKDAHQKNAQDYFLASRSLPWWAIGTSLIAANISAEQIIGMSGSGYVIGLGIASYEWMAALTLVIVGKFSCRSFSRTASTPCRSSSSGASVPRCAPSWPFSGSSSTCSST
jgi:SSS family solute:Na+ symporter